ncbi:hypothetical protein ACIHFD_19250 [Nonomuraea sp. NPDC051941]|uniref:hypothetical protein n=1 Tax=Nonomuraea sp. NPDC051941 TaxID=3364373 RepID=UPI0037C8799D
MLLSLRDLVQGALFQSLLGQLTALVDGEPSIDLAEQQALTASRMPATDDQR